MQVRFDKKAQSVIAIYAIILVLYILLFIVIPFPKSGSAWVSFAFTVLSVVSSLVICGYAFNKPGAMNGIYGFPIFRVGFWYMIAQFAVGVAICTIGAFVTIPYWVALIVSALLMGDAIICAILTGNARDTAVEVEENATQNLQKLTVFNIDIAGIVDSCNDEATKPALQELAALFKYSSDPVSSNATLEIEKNINTELNALKSMIAISDSDVILRKVADIKNFLAERNRICQAYKK